MSTQVPSANNPPWSTLDNTGAKYVFQNQKNAVTIANSVFDLSIDINYTKAQFNEESHAIQNLALQVVKKKLIDMFQAPNWEDYYNGTAANEAQILKRLPEFFQVMSPEETYAFLRSIANSEFGAGLILQVLRLFDWQEYKMLSKFIRNAVAKKPIHIPKWY